MKNVLLAALIAAVASVSAHAADMAESGRALVKKILFSAIIFVASAGAVPVFGADLPTKAPIQFGGPVAARY